MPSLSQRHRPRRFADVTGQEQVTETLRREVATGKLGHAYVFSGPRGVGKTTTARIFAQALLCERSQDGNSCDACSVCVSMREGGCLDVIELDAATHTGVDMVRESIVEHVRFVPTSSKRKVYILDEAHMLSTSSWNALLKTLEEPPPYAFFLLATTEPHKIPATILSRCQQFVFHRVSDDALTKRLESLVREESWNVTPEVISLIVSRAEGCVRDAETILGQLGSLGESVIDRSAASLIIPPSQLPLAAQLFGHWADRNHSASLHYAAELFEQGVAFLALMDDLLLIVRRLLLASADGRLKDQWSAGTEDERAIAALVDRFPASELHDIALLLLERKKDLKSGVDPLFILELASTCVACGLLRHGPGQSTVAPPTIPPVASSSPPSVSPSQPIPPVLESQKEAAPVSEPTHSAPDPAPSQDSAVLELHVVRGKWQAFIRAVDEQNHSLPFILKISQPHEIRGSVLVIRFQYPFHRDKIVTDVKNRRILETCARTVFACPDLTIDGIVSEDSAQAELRKGDMVSTILQAFGGTVVEG